MLAQINFNALRGKLPTNGNGEIDLTQKITIGEILNKLIPWLFTVAGLLLLLYLLYGGYHMMVSRGEPKAMEEAKGKITNALTGFIIIFLAFWIVQIFGKILGINTVFGN